MGTGNVDGSLLLEIVGYAGTFVVTVVTTTWTVATRLSSTKSSLEKKIADAITVLRDERVTAFEVARRERTDQIEASIRLSGEAMAAIRQKSLDIELWGRDNYVLRSDFRIIVEGFTKSMDRLNDKLDRIAEGIRDDREARDNRSSGSNQGNTNR